MNRCFAAAAVCGFLACFLLIGTIAMGLASLVRPEWIYYNVNTTNIVNPTALYSYSHWRGMFDVCLNNTGGYNGYYKSFDNAARQRERNCIELELNPNSNYTKEDGPIIDMRRAHIALHILGIFFGTVTFVYMAIALIVTCSKPKKSTLRCHLFASGSLTAIGTAFYICAFLVFHNLLDKEKLSGTRYNTILDTVRGIATADMKAVTSYSYTHMYACAWSSLLCELLATFLFIIPGMCCTYTTSYDDSDFTSLPMAATPQPKSRNKMETEFSEKTGNDMALRRANEANDPTAPATSMTTAANIPMSQY